MPAADRIFPFFEATIPNHIEVSTSPVRYHHIFQNAAYFSSWFYYFNQYNTAPFFLKTKNDNKPVKLYNDGTNFTVPVLKLTPDVCLLLIYALVCFVKQNE